MPKPRMPRPSAPAQHTTLPRSNTPSAEHVCELIPAPEGWPAELDAKAFHGVAGEIARTLEPDTEADPNAILIQLLIGFGNLIGRNAHIVNDGSKHFMNEFCVLAGRTGRGRKGTSWARTIDALKAADADWAKRRIESGLSSGEGLIEAVKDKELAEGETEEKRLLVIEPEFAGVLSAAGRQGNILSPVTRNAWDTGWLQSLTKTPICATNAHVSIIGHITNEELREKLTRTEQANGFANRFIWICVRRKRKLSRQRREPDLAQLYERFAAAAHFARSVGRMELAPETEPLWDEFYYQLPEETPGISGSLTGRAEGHVSRLACIYALLDRSAVVRPEHLTAAIELWQFSERCVFHIFGEQTGTPIGDTILAQLKTTPDGLTRNELRELFNNHKSSDEIENILRSLAYRNLIQSRRVSTSGRPREVWILANRDGHAPPELGRALREMIPQYTDRQADELWQACRLRAPDCTPDEIAHFVALQMPAIRSGKIHFPVAYLHSAAPPWFESGALKEYRSKQAPPSPPATVEDREAELDRYYSLLRFHQEQLENSTDPHSRAVIEANIAGVRRRLSELERNGEGEGGEERKSRLKREKRGKPLLLRQGYAK